MSNPGEILKEERIKKGLSLKEVSDKIKISANFLDAIENNNLHYLPRGFFTRNFIKTYARFLGLNEEEILREFNLVKESEEIKESGEEKIKKNPLLIILSIFLGILIIIGILILSSKKDHKEDKSSSDLAQHITIPKSLEKKVEDQKKEPDKIQIVIKAIEDTWINADLDGQNILYRLLKKGEEIRFEGKEFLFHAIGRPEGIVVFVNGKECIPMGEPGKVAKNIKIDLKNFWSFVKK